MIEMSLFEKTMCGYTSQYRPDYEGRWQPIHPFRSIADLAQRINRTLHPGYGEPFSRWAFFRSDGEHMDMDYVHLYAASGYLIVHQYGSQHLVFECRFDPEFGFYFRHVSGESLYLDYWSGKI